MLHLELLAVCLGVLVGAVPTSSSKIDPSLLNRLRKHGEVANVFISFHTGTSVLNSFPTVQYETRADRINAIRQLLLENAENSQKSVLALLDSHSTSTVYRTFWINNQVFIKGATPEILESISRLPEVSQIEEEIEIHIHNPVVREKASSGPSPSKPEWGVSLIEAPQAWELDGGNDGANIRVATIDTGVRVTHETLRSNFHPKNGWFDPYEHTPFPNDYDGHGTHVTGIIAGQGGIGVAPGATWLACKGCPIFVCAQEALIECGQFILCPTDPLGGNSDCSQAPHLVSNSWGSGQGRSWFKEVVDAWKVAGIIPLFSNGNSGPGCGSANSPADNPDVIAVGSTTKDDYLSDFSSVGPSVYGTIKPDVTAPGSNVKSAFNTADNAYAILSGTSMASPHAAGIVALLKGRNENLSFKEVKRHLTQGIDRDITPTGMDCGGISEDVWPNHAFGFGRINARKALLSLLKESNSN